MNKFTAINPVNHVSNPSAEFSFMKGKIVLADHRCFCRYRAVKALSDRMVPYFVENQMQLSLARSSVAEIKREIEDPSTDPAYRRSLQSGLQIIQILSESGLIKYIGSEADTTEETFLKYIMLNRTDREIVVLTQQKWLCDDITLLNGLRTVKAAKVQVRRLTNDGFLENFQENQQTVPAPASAGASSQKRGNEQPVNDALMRLGML